MSDSPSNTDIKVREGLSGLRRAIGQAGQVANGLERGQAQMPLVQHLAESELALGSSPFTMILLGLNAESRSAALGWLCGESYHVFKIEVPGPAGLVVIELAEQGYVLEKYGKRTEFDQLEPFLEAVRQADLVRHDDANAWLEPMQLAVAAPSGMQGIRLLMPESLSSLASNPNLLTRLLAQSNFLVVAGPASLELSETEAEALTQLADGVDATWRITTGEVSEAKGIPADWQRNVRNAALPPIHLPVGTSSPTIPAALTNAKGGLRAVLHAMQQARHVESSLTMIEDRLSQDLRQQEARRKALMRHSTNLGGLKKDLELREASETIRRKIEDGLGALDTEIIERIRARTVPQSGPTNRIKNLTEDLCESDFSEERSGKTIRLGVHPDFLARATRVVQEIARKDLGDDLIVIRDAMASLNKAIATSLDDVTGSSRLTSAAALDEDSIWNTLKELIVFESRYHGEMPVRTWMDRISQGRRPVFMIMMTASLVGAAFGQRGGITWLAPMLLLLFVGGVVWTFRSFREEREQKLDKELLRLRDSLAQDIKRLYEQVLREWQTRFSKYLRDVQKEIGRHVEELLREHATQSTELGDREKKELQDKLKLIDRRQRDLANLGQQLQRVRQLASEATRTLHQAKDEAMRQSM